MKGVGEKFNYSKGFLRSTLKKDVDRYKHNIPFYAYYKFIFGACDSFIRELHDCYLPHRRGGGGKHGEDGEVNDFLMAVLLKNVKNAYEEITNSFTNDTNFETFCCEVADQIYLATL